MNSPALPWLPAKALASPRLTEPFARCLEVWSGEWLAAERLEPQPRWEPQDRGSAIGRKFEPVVSRDGLELNISESGRHALVCALLGRTIPQRDIRTVQDRAVIDHLLETALDDLARRLADTLPDKSSSSPAIDPETGHCLTIGCGTIARALQIQLATPVLVRLAQSLAGQPRPAPAPIERRAALDLQRVSLSARIGTTRLTLSELANMTAGDVLTLDAPVSDPLAACIDGRPIEEAALSLRAQDHAVLLQIERPANQW